MPDIVPQSNKAPPQKTLWSWKTAKIVLNRLDEQTFMGFIWDDSRNWQDQRVWKEK